MKTTVENCSEIKITPETESLRPAPIEQDRIHIKFQAEKEKLEVSELEGNYHYKINDLLSNNTYEVMSEEGRIICTCEDFARYTSSFDTSLNCIHILAVENYIVKKIQHQLLKGSHSQLKSNLMLFRKAHPDWGIKTDLVKQDPARGYSLVRADIYDEKGNHRSSGLKLEYRKNPSHCEQAEMGAIEKALAFLGYGSLPFEETGPANSSPVTCNNKATPGQVKYIHDLCKKLKIIPEPDPKNASKKQASQLIAKLQQKMAKEKKKKK